MPRNDVLDLARIFERVPEIMGLDLHRRTTRRWEGGYYLNGQRHSYRKDKMKITPYQGMIWVHEEGGVSVSLPTWLVNVGRAVDYRDAYRILKGEQQPIQHHTEHIFKEHKTIYVPQSALDAMKGFDLRTCPLFRYMCTLFPEERVREVWDMYNVTTDSRGNTCFWYVNGDNKVCFDKRISYLENGHRDKNYFPPRIYRMADGYNARCYFGSHLINNYDTVRICESEKTCLIYTLATSKIMLATGGKGNLKDVDNSALLYPDYDAISDWQSKAKSEDNIVNWWLKWNNCNETSDIGDLIVDKIIRGLDLEIK